MSDVLQIRFRGSLVGLKFGKLTVVMKQENIGTMPMWLCRCDCGKEKTIRGGNLKSGHTKSCGCVQSASRTAARVHGLAKRNNKHPIYNRWKGIKARCYNKSSQSFHNYGGRGITMSAVWRDDFSAFVRDIGLPPEKGMSLDRIDNDGNYEPGNVRWVHQKQQMLNVRFNVRIEHEGQNRTISEWADILGVKSFTLYRRKRAGWSNEDVLTRPIGRR